MTLLSAGVIASLVTGIFSLITSLFNNKRIKQLESLKQQFFFDQKRYDALTNEYFVIASLPSTAQEIRASSLTPPGERRVNLTDLVDKYFERQDLLRGSAEKTVILFDEDLKKEIRETIGMPDKYKHPLLECMAHESGEEVLHTTITEYVASVERFHNKYIELLQEQIGRIQKDISELG